MGKIIMELERKQYKHLKPAFEIVKVVLHQCPIFQAFYSPLSRNTILVYLHLDLYGFSIDELLNAMREGSPDGKWSKKDLSCKFMAMPLKVRIQRLEAGIHELESMMVNGSPWFQRVPGFVEELREHFRFLLAKSKQVS